MVKILFLLALQALLSAVINGFSIPSPRVQGKRTNLKMSVDILHLSDTLVHLNSISSVWLTDAAVPAKTFICPDFGQPGWAPFCFLNGNPVFNAFDGFQLFVQSSIVSFHDVLKGAGIQNAYGPSIILFTICVRLLLSPVTYQQLYTTERTKALNPMIAEIKAKYPDQKDLQNQMVAMLYEETKVNPLAGCLPALLQLPVFIALYRSFLGLANTGEFDESFLWLPNLQGPVFGERSTDWIVKGWSGDFPDWVPALGWHDTLAYISIPIFLVIAQSISLKFLSPPSDDPTVQQSQRILKYLPWMLGYFSLSVPSGLGVYWVINNLLSTASTIGIRQYFKANPVTLAAVDLDVLADDKNSVYRNPVWGYSTRQQMLDEAKKNYRPSRKAVIPADFVA